MTDIVMVIIPVNQTPSRQTFETLGVIGTVLACQCRRRGDRDGYLDQSVSYYGVDGDGTPGQRWSL